MSSYMMFLDAKFGAQNADESGLASSGQGADPGRIGAAAAQLRGPCRAAGLIRYQRERAEPVEQNQPRNLHGRFPAPGHGGDRRQKPTARYRRLASLRYHKSDILNGII